MPDPTAVATQADILLLTSKLQKLNTDFGAAMEVLRQENRKLRGEADEAYGRLDRACTRHVRALEAKVAELEKTVETLKGRVDQVI